MTAGLPSAGVSEPDPRELAWQALAGELAPAKSLARIDAATGRVVTNITVVGVALTGLGLLAASLPAVSALARGLAVGAVVSSVVAVGCALTAQVLTVVKGLNTNDLIQVRDWYAGQFRRRAYPARAGTVLLMVAICLAGAAAGVALLHPGAGRPVLAVSLTQTPVASGTGAGGSGVRLTVEVRFRELADTDVVTVLIVATTPGSPVVLGRALVTPGSDGTVARSIAVDNVPRDMAIDVSATGGQGQCHARLDLAGARPATVHCGRRG